MSKKSGREAVPPSESRLRSVGLLAFVALFVATPLLPGEVVGAKGPAVVFVILWLVLFCGWALDVALQARPRVRWGPPAIAVTAFLLWFAVATYARADQGQPRLTLNVLGQWLSFGLMFILGRQLLNSPRQCRALAAVGVALAVGLSTVGYYQYFYSMPRTIELYESNPELAMAHASIHAPPGSPEWELFRNRVYSTEPLATFSLTNSLAGFLTPWLLVALPGVLATGASVPGGWPARLARLIAVLLIAGCLLLTKSRTAWLATLVGLVLLLIVGRRSGWRPDRRLVVAGLAGLLLLTVGVIAVGGLDWLVIAESSKALRYRLEYWQATTNLIRDFPLWGVGPGNFQQYYTAYKLPGASETVADPHNFLFEIAAASGVVGLIGFLSILVCCAWQGGRPHGESDPVDPDADTGAGGLRPIYWGALAGLGLAFFVGVMVGFLPNMALLALGAPAAALVLAAWHRWILQGSLPPAVVGVALTALLLNLLAAGGIGYPGVAQNVWLLLLIGLALGDQSDSLRPIPRPWTFTIAGGGLLLLLGAYLTIYRPVLLADEKLAEAGLLRSQGRLQEATDALLEATRLDPYDATAWRDLAQLRLQRYLATRSSSDLEQFEAAAGRWIELYPHSSRVRLQVGHWWLTLYRITGAGTRLRQALGAYQEAVTLYPNDSFTRAQYAWALHLADDPAASEQAAIALRLNDQNPHREQALSRRRVFDVGPQPGRGGAAGPGQQNAEQSMLALRKQGGGEF